MEVGRNEVRFGQYVGVIQIGDLTIEVLPKVGRIEPSDHARAKWRVALLDILEIAGITRSGAAADSTLVTTPRPLLDILFDEYLERTRDVVARGLAKAYASTETNLPALKGQIVLPQNSVRNYVHRERHYCRYDVYTTNNRLNRVLKAAIEVAACSSLSPKTAAHAAELLLHFDHVDSSRISFYELGTIAVNRNTEHCTGALTIAKLILSGMLPSLEPGAEPVVALLFDMNELYELYVVALFKRLAQRVPGLQIRGQRAMRFWEHKLIRPDIEIDHRGRKIIVDTKWKIPAGATPADSDLKQMFAYHRVFRSEESYLLYPKTPASANPMPGTYSEGSGRCTMTYVTLFDDDDRVRRDPSPELLELVAESTP